MKKFEKFINENRNEKATQYLIDQAYIKKDEKTDKLVVIQASDMYYPESLIKLNKRRWTDLNYKNLMRYLLLGWIYKYKGEDETILSIKNELDKPYKQRDNSITRPFTQIPTNYTVLKKSVDKILKTNIFKTDNTDPIALGTIIARKDILFTEDNVNYWYSIVDDITKIANESENKIVDLIKNKNLFKNPRNAEGKDDMLGVDVWVDNFKGEKIGIQVKEPSYATNITMSWGPDFYEKDGKKINKKPEYVIKIANTNIDFKAYNKWNDGELIWKFLFLIDKKRKKVYQINSSGIKSINKGRNVFINMNLDEEWLPKMIKTYDLS